MDLILTRNDYTKAGIFGILTDTEGQFIAATLEHAFSGDNNYEPKIPSGNYICTEGEHTLEHSPTPFKCFQVMNVPNHTKILIHWGNFNNDSDGCILIGSERNGNMIMDSKVTFEKFMGLQKDVDSFTLTVI